jgi:hypothetical protein
MRLVGSETSWGDHARTQGDVEQRLETQRVAAFTPLHLRNDLVPFHDPAAIDLTMG